ncbi:MAG: CBS domain-containing protein [Parasphingopyxis sp.]|uniref:CBS domain-containing protein n=1 Tax=Parasphingopyxis sp. TaxID=1920299 RepID=UPI003FA019BF
MKVKDVMHDGVAWVEPDTLLSKVAVTMRDEDVGSIPVGEDDRLVGMVTDRDIAIRALADGKDPLQLTAGDVMTDEIFYCTADEEVEDAVRIMENNEIRRLPVIDHNKRMVGMLSMGDVAARAPASLSSEMLKAVSAHHP